MHNCEIPEHFSSFFLLMRVKKGFEMAWDGKSKKLKFSRFLWGKVWMSFWFYVALNFNFQILLSIQKENANESAFKCFWRKLKSSIGFHSDIIASVITCTISEPEKFSCCFTSAFTVETCLVCMYMSSFSFEWNWELKNTSETWFPTNDK